ncbi:MAG: LPP20 family lipoprotein [Gammaproteobacteria bacterium]|nr:LPP20 family lipoprotein [Gammaproteobacteria bacterium]
MIYTQIKRQVISQYFSLLVMLISACTPVAPVVTQRGEPPAQNKIQTTLPEGGLKPENMRVLGAEAAKPPSSALPKTAKARHVASAGRNLQSGEIIYTDNPEDCPAGTAVGYGNAQFMGTDRKTVEAIGRGAPPKDYYSPTQRRLLAQRAATLDAYRNLAEQVYGMRIYGNSTVSDMTMQNDRVRVMIDKSIKDAQIVMSNPIEDGTYEVTVQMTVINPVLAALRAEAVRPRCVSIEQLTKTTQP